MGAVRPERHRTLRPGATGGIVDQSLRSRMAPEPTNRDGFGLGWYGGPACPGVHRSVSPAWADSQLLELAGAIDA